MGTTTWTIDPTHSEIGFKIKHMMFTNVSGKFNTVEAHIENDGVAFESSKISFSAEVNSIDTNSPDRDNHLKSADFFDAVSFPKLAFTSTHIEKIKDGEYKIDGNLTIKNITQKITLDAAYSGAMKDPWGNTKVGLSVTGNINRKDFGLTWNSTLETGGVLVGEDVRLVAEMQFTKQ